MQDERLIMANPTPTTLFAGKAHEGHPASCMKKVQKIEWTMSYPSWKMTLDWTTSRA
jgi:hypothetical protein